MYRLRSFTCGGCKETTTRGLRDSGNVSRFRLLFFPLHFFSYFLCFDFGFPPFLVARTVFVMATARRDGRTISENLRTDVVRRPKQTSLAASTSLQPGGQPAGSTQPRSVGSRGSVAARAAPRTASPLAAPLSLAVSPQALSEASQENHAREPSPKPVAAAPTPATASGTAVSLGYDAGTIKHAAFVVLFGNSDGLTVPQLVDAISREELHSWVGCKTPRNSVTAALSQDYNFRRVRPWTYALCDALRPFGLVAARLARAERAAGGPRVRKRVRAPPKAAPRAKREKKARRAAANAEESPPPAAARGREAAKDFEHDSAAGLLALLRHSAPLVEAGGAEEPEAAAAADAAADNDADNDAVDAGPTAADGGAAEVGALVGRLVRKLFHTRHGRKAYAGRIVSFDSARRAYLARFSDGDTCEMDEGEAVVCGAAHDAFVAANTRAPPPPGASFFRKRITSKRSRDARLAASRRKGGGAAAAGAAALTQ